MAIGREGMSSSIHRNYRVCCDDCPFHEVFAVDIRHEGDLGEQMQDEGWVSFYCDRRGWTNLCEDCVPVATLITPEE